MRNAWIVEASWEIEGKFGVWGSTVGIALNRKGGRMRLREWKSRNPNDRFRLVRYVPAARAAEEEKKP